MNIDLEVLQQIYQEWENKEKVLLDFIDYVKSQRMKTMQKYYDQTNGRIIGEDIRNKYIPREIAN